jgi:(E)-4-hydroxy-3-methyl-but-2-enyl pyrophosphate reductase
MSVKLAETAGFCMGVKRAVDMVLDIAQRKGKENIYTYGPLIHNPQTVEIMMKRGMIPIQDIAEINATDTGATIIIRAHGISPQERKKIKEKGIRIVDATCPKVAHVQAIIRKHASRDYAIIIVGDADHPEVNGLLGHAHGKGIVIGSVNDVDRLPPLEKVCVVAQTTQNMDEFNEIVSRIRERFPDTVIFNTICDSTEKRQAEVKRLSAETDAVFIIGGRNSANTRRLATISELQGKPTFHIETAEELNQISIRGFERIGVSAGASTPNWIIDVRNNNGGDDNTYAPVADAVIGNPPYVRMETFKEFKDYLKARYVCHAERSDLYAYMIERAHQLLRPQGRFGMIVSNKFLRARYGQPLREFLRRNARIETVDVEGQVHRRIAGGLGRQRQQNGQRSGQHRGPGPIAAAHGPASTPRAATARPGSAAPPSSARCR